MKQIYLPRPDRYLATQGIDPSPYLERYGEEGLRGLVDVTIRSFNLLKATSEHERKKLKIDTGASLGDVVQDIAVALEGELRSLTGYYPDTVFLIGRPDLISAMTESTIIHYEPPLNGCPFMDHEVGELIRYLERNGYIDGAFCIDTLGNTHEARRIRRPERFELNGTGERILEISDHIDERHADASYASKNGLMAVTLNRDGSVIGFADGQVVKGLTHASDKKRMTEQL